MAINQEVLSGQRYKSLTTIHSRKSRNEIGTFLLIFASVIAEAFTIGLLQIKGAIYEQCRLFCYRCPARKQTKFAQPRFFLYLCGAYIFRYKHKQNITVNNTQQ